MKARLVGSAEHSRSPCCPPLGLANRCCVSVGGSRWAPPGVPLVWSWRLRAETRGSTVPLHPFQEEASATCQGSLTLASQPLNNGQRGSLTARAPRAPKICTRGCSFYALLVLSVCLPAGHGARAVGKIFRSPLCRLSPFTLYPPLGNSAIRLHLQQRVGRRKES